MPAKMARSAPWPPFGATPVTARDSCRQSGLPEGGKSAKIHAGLGFIWGIRIRIMFISHTDVGDNLRKIVILGRLDIPGTESVAGELEKLAAAPKKGVVVDLSSLKFLASIGIRALFKSAKVVKERGGRMVLVVGTNSQVVMSLEATGVNKLIPMFKSNAEAERAAVA
jgi:anti-anti-sigma factor